MYCGRAFCVKMCTRVVLSLIAVCGVILNTIHTSESRILSHCASLDYVRDVAGLFYGLLALNGNTRPLGINVDITLDDTADILKSNFGKISKISDGNYRIFDDRYDQPSNRMINITFLVRRDLAVDQPVEALKLNGKYICFSAREVPIEAFEQNLGYTTDDEFSGDEFLQSAHSLADKPSIGKQQRLKQVTHGKA